MHSCTVAHMHIHTFSHVIGMLAPSLDMRWPYAPERARRSMRHGYFSAISFVDEQVGRVLGKSISQ